ncbi:alpha/beta hydrolase family protein [Paremcibacter congregatus]|uniref:Peptidase S9 n=1 Tax=Paremcibacter congregatus TaxID=2043170 RepID=A0A2G4YWD7_9PROT|nr:prolyl oligopeptidase family serine peptidase [Paremcibacter congregatus]PHZ86560.1 peptidase S9 [Paremcibacter congregatus]QDE26365.1 S9 family peptidase [Paremcibacter congregatus]
MKIFMFVVWFLTFATPVMAETLPLDAFAMRPAIQRVSVSPNGKMLGMLRGQSLNGDYIMEIYSTDDMNAKPVRLGADVMEITGFTWLNDDRLWVDFRQNLNKVVDKFGGGDKTRYRYRSYLINSDGTGKWTEVPADGQVRVVSMLPKSKDEILISYDSNDNHWPDYVRYNIKNGRKKTIMRGSNKYSGGYGVDYDGDIRIATSFDISDLTVTYHVRKKNDDNWIQIETVRAMKRETFSILGFNPENENELFVQANNGEDTASIWAMDINTGKYTEKLFGLKSVDAGGILINRKPGKEGQLLGFHYATSKPKRVYIDQAEKALYEAVQDLFPEHHSRIISRSDDDASMVIFVNGPKEAGSYYLLKNKAELSFLGARYPKIKSEHLSDVKYIKYKARDGMIIPAYLTIPKGEAPFPTVIVPHGGPWVRDHPGFDEWAQFLAHHGYLVLQPNYRGSTGYGLKHWKAGDAKWGLEMQDDLDDGMNYLVEKGLADKNRLAMFGWSYGGYTAFVASTRGNNIYKCVVAGAGVSDMNKISAGLYENYFSRKVAGPFMKGVSPVEIVEKVNIPIFVIHGDIDRRVDVEHSRAFVDELKKYHKDYKYIELEGADHFSNTLFYDHKTTLYSELLDWLGNKCFK